MGLLRPLVRGLRLVRGEFRPALHFQGHRLAVLRITLPPLRERVEDLPSLTRELLASMGATAESKAALSTPEFLASLARGAWPGNWWCITGARAGSRSFR